MDSSQGMAMGTLLTALTGIAAYLVRWNHKRIRSKCCGKPCVTSIDVEDTTPVAEIKEEQPTTK